MVLVKSVSHCANGTLWWNCTCDCGTNFCKPTHLVRRNKSCGCRMGRHVHGGAGTPTYKIWSGIKKRCLAIEDARYGGRGISMCDRWSNFASFFADMGERPTGMSIDRIDNNKGYEPGNCRWATPAEQSRNTRRNVKLTHNGQTLCVADWSKETGINAFCLYQRIRKLGWSVSRALTTPL